MNRLYYRHALDDNLDALWANWQTEQPQLCWFDPTPIFSENIQQPCETLCAGLPDTLPSFDELRLFWKDRATHLVRVEGGWRWFEYGEKLIADDKLKPLEQEVIIHKTHIMPRVNWDTVTAKRPAVLGTCKVFYQERNRSQWKTREQPLRLQVCTYHHPDDGHLFAWRLLPPQMTIPQQEKRHA